MSAADRKPVVAVWAARVAGTARLRDFLLRDDHADLRACARLKAEAVAFGAPVGLPRALRMEVLARLGIHDNPDGDALELFTALIGTALDVIDWDALADEVAAADDGGGS